MKYYVRTATLSHPAHSVVLLALKRLTKSRILFLMFLMYILIPLSSLPSGIMTGGDGLLTSISDVLDSSPNPPQDSSTLTQNTFTPLISLFHSFISASSRSLQGLRMSGNQKQPLHIIVNPAAGQGKGPACKSGFHLEMCIESFSLFTLPFHLLSTCCIAYHAP